MSNANADKDTGSGIGDEEFHRKMAVDLFNLTWTLLDRTDRTPEDTDTMIHAAHASRYHWSRVPGHQPVHLARGEWQVARVYSVAEHHGSALYHAGRCLEICEAHGIGDFDIAFAHEAMARAFAGLGDHDACRRHRDRARELGAKIADPEDRDLLLSDLASGPWFGFDPGA